MELINPELIKDIRKAPELEKVEIIEVEKDRLNLIFETGTQRTGSELLKIQDLLFKYQIYNFIKSEKVLLYENIIKTITISIY